MINQRGGAVRQPRVHGKSVVRRAEILDAGKTDRRRNALAAHLGRVHGIDPAACAEFLIGFAEGFGNGDNAVFNMTPFFVTLLAGRRQLIDGEFLGLVQDHGQIILGKILVGFVRKQLLDPQLLEQNKLLIPRIH